MVLGGTGLVGGHLVRLLARDEDVAEVVAPSRRATGRFQSEEGVRVPVLDFARLREEAPRLFGGSDQLFLCLGTTMKKAGSRQAFIAVDHDLTLNVARLAVEAGIKTAFLVSSVGADPASRAFYLRVKGEVEQTLTTLPFDALHIVRPAILAGDREERRPGERFGLAVLSTLSPLMVGPLRRQRPVRASTVAAALAVLARAPGEGAHVHESEALPELAARY